MPFRVSAFMVSLHVCCYLFTTWLAVGKIFPYIDIFFCSYGLSEVGNHLLFCKIISLTSLYCRFNIAYSDESVRTDKIKSEHFDSGSTIFCKVNCVKNIQKVQKEGFKHHTVIYNPDYFCKLLLNFHPMFTARSTRIL